MDLTQAPGLARDLRWRPVGQRLAPLRRPRRRLRADRCAAGPRQSASPRCGKRLGGGGNGCVAPVVYIELSGFYG